MAGLQQTFFMIKPEIVGAPRPQVGAILDVVETAGFRITGLAMRQFDRATVEEFYGEHRDKPFFGPLCDYILGGKVVAVRLERENAVAALRELIGATNPEEAAVGTIRNVYGTSLQHNAVHASANAQDAARELGIIFS
jgi:nucleoside-diphosphate kinase